MHPGQTGTIVNDRVSPYFVVLPVPVLRSYISMLYTERKTTVYDSCIRNPYAVSVFLRISPSTIVSLRIQSRRYTIVIRAQVIRQKTVVYDCKGIVDGRLRPHTKPVILDLGTVLRLFLDGSYTVKNS